MKKTTNYSKAFCTGLKGLFKKTLIAGVFSTLCFSESIAQGSLSTGLTHQYCFDGNANDTKGSLHGTVIGATLTTGHTGLANTAYQFNGTSDYIDLPNDVWVAGDFTVSAWVLMTNPGTDNWQRVFEFGNGPSSGNNVFYSTRKDPSMGFGCGGGAGISNGEIYGCHRDACGGTICYNVGTTFPTSSWIFVTVVQNGTTNSIYRNGVLTSSTTMDPPCAVTRTENFFGKSNFSNPFFKGKLDDIKIYSRALSASEVNLLYAVTTCESASSSTCDDYCYWKLDGSGAVAPKNILGTMHSTTDVRLFTGGSQRGVLTSGGNFGWGTATTAPSSKFHVNVTGTTATTGIRFQGLTSAPALTDVLVVDASGNVATRPVSTLSGSGGTGWSLTGNSVSTTDFLGTTNSEDLRIKTGGAPVAKITKEGNFDFGSNTFSTSTSSHTKSVALGNSNTVTNSINSFATGELNEIDESLSSGCLGTGNSVISGENNYTIGKENSITTVPLSTSVTNVAIGARNQIVESEESVIAGEQNYLEKSHGSFIGGSHNDSYSGNYAMFLGMGNKNHNGDNNILVGTGNSSLSGSGQCHIYGNESIAKGNSNFVFGNTSNLEGNNNFAFGNSAESIGAGNFSFGNDAHSIGLLVDNVFKNIFTFGQGITNRKNNSMIFGFDNNRTAVITKRGLAVQLHDPSPSVTYDPNANFEVQASVSPLATPMLPISIGSLRSNIRFHNLPSTNILYPPVVIDPSTGELFLYDPNVDPPVMGQGNAINNNNPLQQALEKQQIQIAEQQKQIDELKAIIQNNASLNSNEQLTLQKDGFLAQNVPNPFSVSTTIKYELPKGTQKATIGIYDMNGREMKLFQLSSDKTGSVLIQGGDLMPGMYLYSLIIDGKYFDSKKMILTSQ